MMIVLITNFSFGGGRRQWKDGVEWFVAPMTMIVPGVLAGSEGPILYPPEEIARNVGAWNGVAITVGHPTDERGRGVSAKSAAVLQKYAIGKVENARVDGALKAEAWIAIERAKQVDGRVINALLSGKRLELSTGLHVKREPKAGVHNGRSYHGIATNLKPDHLAVFVDQVGACSITDGCGVLVNSKLKGSDMCKFENEDADMALPYVNNMGGATNRGSLTDPDRTSERGNTGVNLERLDADEQEQPTPTPKPNFSGMGSGGANNREFNEGDDLLPPSNTMEQILAGKR